MSVWILIIMMAGGAGVNAGADVHHIRFADRTACERARSAIIPPKRTHFTSVCVRNRVEGK